MSFELGGSKLVEDRIANCFSLLGLALARDSCTTAWHPNPLAYNVKADPRT